jgi:hypothetical protein
MPAPAQNLLPGVPFVESPFFDQIFTAASFDAETLRIARDLREQGYAIIDFPDADFAARTGRIRANLNPRYDWEAWRNGTKESLRVQDAWEFDADVHALAANPKILALLSALYGRRAFPFQTLNFPVGTQQHVHSDSVHFSSSPERFMCGVWVPFEDIGPDQGPLVYLPGTHRWPIYTNEHLGVNSSFLFADYGQYPQLKSLWTALAAAHRIEPVRFLAKKGQALIWAANLLHGGDRQHNLSLTRWSQVTHYYFDNCSYYTPISTDAFYGKIHFRELRDIATGQPMPNRVAGHAVPAEFIRATAPQPVIRDEAFFAHLGLPADFDSAGYAKLNPDVAAAGGDPRAHYLQFGQFEGRRWH